MDRRNFLKSASVAALATGSGVAAPAIWSPAKADARQETLLIVSEGGPNNLDVQGVGTNVPGYETSWNCYDRLISHEMKTLANGTQYYDRDKFKPELAEDMSVGDMSVTFKLRKDATFQDATPVTAKDVKWSLDRSVTVGGFPTFQMKAASLEKPEQFVVVDDHTFRVDFLRKDRLTIPGLAVIVPCVINSELVKKNATTDDPWGLQYTKQNTVGSGAYKVVRWMPGTEIIFERNEAWKSGPIPKIRRVIWRMVPDAGNRRALLERGDADISYDLPNKDVVELKNSGNLTIISTPYSNGIQYLGMNVTKPPFDNLKVRQAVAYAVPYQKIMDAVLGPAKPVFGARPGAPIEAVWPQADSYNTNIAKAKQLIAEAGYPNGFQTTLSFDLGSADVNEPQCELIQENLGHIGIKATLDKIPGANWRTVLYKKVMPIYTNVFAAWFDYPEYFFFQCYDGQNMSVFNTMGYQSKDMDAYIDGARMAAATGDMATYDKDVKGFVGLAFTDIPRIPLYQPYVNVAMQKNISGYEYWFHRRLDYRALMKT